MKAYLRYEHSLCFGIVASTSSRTAKIVEGFPEKGDTAIAPALEGINLWQLRKVSSLLLSVVSGFSQREVLTVLMFCSSSRRASS